MGRGRHQPCHGPRPGLAALLVPGHGHPSIRERAVVELMAILSPGSSEHSNTRPFPSSFVISHLSFPWSQGSASFWVFSPIISSKQHHDHYRISFSHSVFLTKTPFPSFTSSPCFFLEPRVARRPCSAKIHPLDTSPRIPGPAPRFPLRTALHHHKLRPKLTLLVPPAAFEKELLIEEEQRRSANTSHTRRIRMGAMPQLGALGHTFTAMRAMQLISLVAIVGMTGDFVAEMVAADSRPPDVLIGTLVVVSCALPSSS